MRRLSITAVIAAGACALVAAGCGGSSSSSSAGSAKLAASTGSGGDALAASGGKADVTAKDFSFSSKTIDAKAGKLTVSLKNAGQEEHEFVLLKTDAAPASLKVKGGSVSESDSVGEIGDVEAGGSGQHTFNLKPGHYVFVCNVPGHYMQGMRGALTVH
jgi:uncharacterized cupredoxin-like copper-binding protein